MDYEFYNNHYITVDKQGRITDAWSDGPHPEKDISDAICINDKGGYQFRFEPNGEENPALWDYDGIPLYKWEGDQVVRRSEAELKADRALIPAPPPSPMEQMRADVDFLLCLGGVV